MALVIKYTGHKVFSQAESRSPGVPTAAAFEEAQSLLDKGLPSGTYPAVEEFSGHLVRLVGGEVATMRLTGKAGLFICLFFFYGKGQGDD